MRLASTLLLVSGLTGCGALADTGAGVEVAAGFYPLQYVAERIAGDQAQVEVLTQPGGEPHDATLSVRETALVAEADVLVVAGGVQPAVDDAVANAAEGGTVVDTSSPDFETSNTPAIRPDDPHFWLDPLLMADLGDEVAEALATPIPTTPTPTAPTPPTSATTSSGSTRPTRRDWRTASAAPSW